MIMPSPDSVTFPPASATVSVKAILAFTGLTMGAEDFFVPADGTADAGGPLAPWVAPGYSFLVEHTATGRRVVFDLGMRKDPTTFAPPFIKAEGKVEVKIKNDVAEQIQAGGIELNSVEAVIWSHCHFDHTGDPSTFPHSTALVVGPGLKNYILPGYPAKPTSFFLETDFSGRKICEIEFPEDAPKISGLSTLNYFGDGSFYLLDAPGHCTGHMLGLARVSTGVSPSFILLAGDTVHHPALLRPTEHFPLPEKLYATIPAALRNVGAPSYVTPFLAPSRQKWNAHEDLEVALRTTAAVQALDAREDVLVLLAHDGSLGDVLDLFPKALNGWKDNGVKERAAWAFLEAGNAVNRWQN